MSIKITATVRNVQVGTEPPICIFPIELDTPTSTWSEVFGSRRELEIFLLGVRAGASLAGGRFDSPEIPVQPTVKARLRFRGSKTQV